jgi:hypothetical protein
MPHQFEVRIVQKMRNVVARATVEIVYAKNIATISEESLAQMGPQEAGASGDQDSLPI